MSTHEDPIVRSGRREAFVVMLIWLSALGYTLTYCYLCGYNQPAESLKLVLGFPAWVFWGIVLPWTVCVLISWAFSAVFMRDADLGRDVDDPTNDRQGAADA
jgi:hypothetical protein